MLEEFKKFAMRGNVVDMAVGIIIGAAFGRIVSSAVNDVIMPPIGMALGDVNFSELYVNLTDQAYESLAAAVEAGAPVIKYGAFAQTIIDFLIVGFVIFVVIKGMNRMKAAKEAEPEAPPAPPEPSAEEKLLTEIRDTLKQNS